MSGCSNCPSANLSEEHTADPKFRLILWVALWANLIMFGVELAASWYGDSLALQADAIDFFGDAANYGISLFVLGMALQQRANAALIKAASMGLIGLWVLASAVQRWFDGSSPNPVTMATIGALALCVNLSVAVMLYRFRTGDSNTQSIWLCSRNDAIANLAVIAAASGVFAAGSHWPDLAVASLVALLSLTSAYRVVRLAIQERRPTNITVAMPSPLAPLQNPD